MVYYERIDMREGNDHPRSNTSKASMIWHYWFFNHGFKLQDSVCNGCHHLTILCLNISDTAIITIKNVDYHCISHIISKSEAINLLEKSVLEHRGYIQKCISKKSILKLSLQLSIWQFSQNKKLETKNILIDQKDYKDFTIYFSRYVHGKSIKMLSLHYHESMGKINENEGKNIFNGR